jgi:hypothetical protein
MATLGRFHVKLEAHGISLLGPGSPSQDLTDGHSKLICRFGTDHADVFEADDHSPANRSAGACSP